MSPTTLTRVLVGVLAGALCGLVVTCGVLVVRDGRAGAGPEGQPGGAATAASDAAPVPDRVRRAREVLRAWDAARARAWTSGDTRALTRLYAPGSGAGERDVAMLRAWTERGARLTDLTTQVLRLQVRAADRRRLVLVVTDRVAQALATGAGTTVLPRDRPTTRRIVLVRGGGRWLVASVSPEPPARS